MAGVHGDTHSDSGSAGTGDDLDLDDAQGVHPHSPEVVINAAWSCSPGGTQKPDTSKMAGDAGMHMPEDLPYPGGHMPSESQASHSRWFSSSSPRYATTLT